MSRILKLRKLRPETALENLNRLTGLDFQQWPESLISETDTEQNAEATQNGTGQHAVEPCRQQG